MINHKVSLNKKIERKTGYHHGNLKETLVKASLNIIMEEGVNSVTIRKVAKVANVSHTAPYRHFEDKDALLAEVAKQGFDIMVRQTRKRFEKFPDEPLARLRESGLALIDFAVENPSYYLIMFGSGKHNEFPTPELKASSKEAFMLLYQSILDCQEENLVKNEKPGGLAVAAWSIVHGFAMLAINGHIGNDSSTSGHCIPGTRIDRLKKTVIKALYEGLKF